MTLDLFQNCDVPVEVSATFDPEVDLNDKAIGLISLQAVLFCSQ